MAVNVNDAHSALNATSVSRVIAPWTESHLVGVIRRAIRSGTPVAVAGGRHAMGGQQFRRDALLIDMRSLNRLRRFDAEKGTVEVEAGMMWPGLFDTLADLQRGAAEPWVVRQKQTGADKLTLGGAVAANIHGRGLKQNIKSNFKFSLLWQ